MFTYNATVTLFRPAYLTVKEYEMGQDKKVGVLKHEKVTVLKAQNILSNLSNYMDKEFWMQHKKTFVITLGSCDALESNVS